MDSSGRANEVLFRDPFNRVVNVSFRQYDMALVAPTTPKADAAPVIDLEANEAATGGDSDAKMSMILTALQQQSSTINGQS